MIVYPISNIMDKVGERGGEVVALPLPIGKVAVMGFGLYHLGGGGGSH